jgi:CheY-like chemotaxis protein
LIRVGYEVMAVRDGSDALRAAKTNVFDLFIMDMLMPGMDGIQTIRAIREIRPEAPILGLTGYIGRGYLVQADSLGVKCLSKPIIISDLIEEIKLLLDKPNQLSEGPG